MTFLWLHFTVPLGVGFLLAAILGGLTVVLIGVARITQIRLVARRHARSEHIQATQPLSDTALVNATSRSSMGSCGPMRQSERTDLLPDQRWVRLIGLEGDDLQPEFGWRRLLRPGTLVAPGWAGTVLGLPPPALRMCSPHFTRETPAFHLQGPGLSRDNENS